MAKKKLKFGSIRIYFRDGKTDVIPKKLWDDYEYNGCLFIIKRRAKRGWAWIATYNIGDISAVIVDCRKKKK